MVNEPMPIAEKKEVSRGAFRFQRTSKEELYFFLSHYYPRGRIAEQLIRLSYHHNSNFLFCFSSALIIHKEQLTWQAKR
jgi:hypothetical protein